MPAVGRAIQSMECFLGQGWRGRGASVSLNRKGERKRDKTQVTILEEERCADLDGPNLPIRDLPLPSGVAVDRRIGRDI